MQASACSRLPLACTRTPIFLASFHTYRRCSQPSLLRLEFQLLLGYRLPYRDKVGFIVSPSSLQASLSALTSTNNNLTRIYFLPLYCVRRGLRCQVGNVQFADPRLKTQAPQHTINAGNGSAPKRDKCCAGGALLRRAATALPSRRLEESDEERGAGAGRAGQRMVVIGYLSIVNVLKVVFAK